MGATLKAGKSENGLEMARPGVRHSLLRALLAGPAGGQTTTALQQRLPPALAHKPHISEELAELVRLGVVVGSTRDKADARIRHYYVENDKRLAAVHYLYDVGRDRLPKVAGAACAPSLDRLRLATNELAAAAPGKRGDLAFSREALFAETGSNELCLLLDDFAEARIRLRDRGAARGPRNPIRRRRDDYHKDGAMDIQSFVLLDSLGAPVTDDATTGPLNLNHIETGLQSSDADLTSLPLSAYLAGRRELMANGLVPVAVGLPWSQHVILSHAAATSRIVDTIYTVGCSVLSPKVMAALRAHGLHVEAATEYSVAFEAAAQQMKGTADRRVAFLMEAHMAIPLRASMPQQFAAAITVVDQGVQLARATSLAPWVAGSAEDFRTTLTRIFTGVPQQKLMRTFAPLHFARSAGKVVPGLPGEWSSSDVNSPVANRKLAT